jgi:hypothetical protein
MNEHALLAQAQQKLGEIPGRLMFTKVAGSHSHNTNLETSDLDVNAVYQVPTHDLLGIDPIRETLVRDENNVTVHEIGKFCALLLKGNPNILECLFTERMFCRTLEFDQLICERMRFVSEDALSQYVGYLLAQLKRLHQDRKVHTSGGTYNSKFAYHMIRMGLEANRIAKALPPMVWYEGPEHALLMRVRRGEFSREQVTSLAEEQLKGAQQLDPRLRVHGDREWLSAWLTRVRMEGLQWTR